MGNGYKNQLHPQSLYHRSSFLPMLCRVSIKDVSLSQFKDRSFSFSDEPSSPKVSCMGQVKRNNKVIGFPTPYRLNSAASSANTTPSKSSSIAHNHMKYTKLKKLFSSKNLITGTAITTATTNNGNSNTSNVNRCGSKSCTSSREIKRGVARKQQTSKNGDCNIKVNVGELDPPLPVIKKVQPPGAGRDEINIWKRRFGGAALNGLQIKQIQLPENNCLPPPTTV